MNINISINTINEGNPTPIEEQSTTLRFVVSEILRGNIEGECFLDEIGTGHNIRSYWKLKIKEE